MLGQKRERDRTQLVLEIGNERENVERIIGRVRGSLPEVDVLVADDNSPDGTGAIADAIAVPVLLQLGVERHYVEGLAGFGQLQHRRKHPLVAGIGKIFGAHFRRGQGQRVGQDRRQAGASCGRGGGCAHLRPAGRPAQGR